MPAVAYEVDGETAVLTIDYPPVNALAHEVRLGICEGLQRASESPDVKAVVVMCAGRMFSAGADITEFNRPGGPAEPRIRQIVSIIEATSKPVIAAIHGAALGGGLELAMSCHWRIASPGTKFGLPEVNLGLIPGAGGTQRLTRLVGPEAAIEMMTSGTQYGAAFALENGLVDELVTGDLRTAAIDFARRVVKEGQPPRATSRLGDKIADIDPGIFDAFRKKIGRRVRGQLAPWKCIDGVEIACRDSFAAGTQFEIEAFDECYASPQRAALTHLFRAEREARKIPGLEGVAPLPVRKAAIIGSGTMGGGIAMAFANAGLEVALIDISPEALSRGMGVIERNYANSLERGSTTRENVQAALARFSQSTDYAAAGDADIVIECVIEDMATKKQVFAALDSHAAPHAILATNTSSLDIDEIASATARPDRVVGTHFFSPANVMKLLENVRGAKSSPETLATVMELGKRLGKIPVLAGNCNGFIGNRMFQFYNNAWEYLLEEGATPEQIDRVALEFGMAMGPVAVRDMAGLDVACMVRKARAPSLPKEERISSILERLVEAGRLGQKTGAGLYRYDGRTPFSDPLASLIIEKAAAEAGVTRHLVADEEIMPRMLAPLVNEGAKILEEGIALRASDIDVTYCHGYGFPKHLGGPMFWAANHGLGKIVETLGVLAERFGPRYQPSLLLVKQAGSGKGW